MLVAKKKVLENLVDGDGEDGDDDDIWSLARRKRNLAGSTEDNFVCPE